jgi:carboxyl-terminal processing protease
VFAPGEIIAEMKERKRATKVKAEDRGDVFRGKVAVLVDSESGSASEVFARWMQLEGRARVLGDRSAGAVMVSEFHGRSQGHEALFTIYGLSVTRAELVMPDGSRLEGVGVTPDDVVLPSAANLAAGRDPALARAVEVVGGTLDATAAGRLFPRIWQVD